MALQTTGPISLGDIQTEFGGTNPIAISEYYGAGGAPASGQISIGDFYGLSAEQWFYDLGTKYESNTNIKLLSNSYFQELASRVHIRYQTPVSFEQENMALRYNLSGINIAQFSYLNVQYTGNAGTVNCSTYMRAGIMSGTAWSMTTPASDNRIIDTTTLSNFSIGTTINTTAIDSSGWTETPNYLTVGFSFYNSSLYGGGRSMYIDKIWLD